MWPKGTIATIVSVENPKVLVRYSFPTTVVHFQIDQQLSLALFPVFFQIIYMVSSGTPQRNPGTSHLVNWIELLQNVFNRSCTWLAQCGLLIELLCFRNPIEPQMCMGLLLILVVQLSQTIGNYHSYVAYGTFSKRLLGVFPGLKREGATAYTVCRKGMPIFHLFASTVSGRFH